jgi:predicted HicB family RNase H-like nuclease
VRGVPQPELAGTNPESALKGSRKIIADVIKDMRKNKEPIPEPHATKGYSGKFLVRVPTAVHHNLAIKAAEERVCLNRLASSELST